MTISRVSPFTPSYFKSVIDGNRPLEVTYANISDTNAQSTSSFLYDSSTSPLKSTQQLKLDWSAFENHTFFMSAEAKVNIAFEKIINGFPFDGTRSETESFFESLTGFEKYVFDSFPKHRGYLHFSGSAATGETTPDKGTYIIVNDYAGGLYPELSKTKNGSTTLNPSSDTSFSIEMQLFVPDQAHSDVQVICQKMNGTTQGFSLSLRPSGGGVDTIESRFIVVSGSKHLLTSADLEKGVWNHICVVCDRDHSNNATLKFFKNSVLQSETPTSNEFGTLDIDSATFLIGSGTQVSAGANSVLPFRTLSGSIDELRVFHSSRTAAQQKQWMKKSIYPTSDLMLYYRFNEPATQLVSDPDSTVNAIVLDSSGRSLHSTITNYSTFAQYDTSGNITGSFIRMNTALDATSNMTLEKNETAPVLFPAHEDVVDLNTTLLFTASLYDDANPNLITKLFPQHYFLEGAAFEGHEEPEGGSGDQYSGDGIPGQGKLGNVQLLLSLLYVWALFFDEMKLYIDAFSRLRSVDYDENKSMPNNFMYDFTKLFGFNLPPLFNDSTMEQYVRGDNITNEDELNTHTLRDTQNELLRRVLVNLPTIIKSKGTQHSIRAFLRSIGMDPDTSVRIREYGGPTTKQLSFARERRRETATMVQFFTSSLAISPFLSGSRIETGYPHISGTFVNKPVYPPHGISNQRSDGLFTSGSWSVENVVKFPIGTVLSTATQSLMRMHVTGSVADGVGLIANLVAISSSLDPHLKLYVRAGNSSVSPTMALRLNTNDSTIFDGDKWHISFGCIRADEAESYASSSYFIRAATQNEGDISAKFTTSSFFEEKGAPTESNAFRTINQYAASGSFLTVGQNISIPAGGGSTYLYLNNTSAVSSEARATEFDGRMSDLRFWSLALDEDEWLEHVRNHLSHGVDNPLSNYNYVSSPTGSFERLRLSTFTKQDTTRAISTASFGTLGTITFLDFSENGNHMTGSGFSIDEDCVVPELFDINSLSPYYDEAVSDEKVRVRGYSTYENYISTPWAQLGPAYDIPTYDAPTDDVRFTVDFSLTDALNRDIITMFSTLDAIASAIGSPELLFSPDYPDMERLRDVYFNRIKEKLNFDAFFTFFRWFDTSIGTFIEQLIPRKTSFKGTNFVVESHMLERHKLEHHFTEQYIGESDRRNIRDTLLLQQVVGSMKKW